LAALTGGGSAAPRYRRPFPIRLSPDERGAIQREFDRRANMTQAWPETPWARRLGMVRKGGTESAGRRSAKTILVTCRG